MKRVKTIAWLLALALLLTALPVTRVAATQTDAVWQSVSLTGNEVVVSLHANTAVAAGQLQLNYDASKLTFVAVEEAKDHVGFISVNADTAGVVKIAFVGTGASAEGNAYGLLKVRFSGADRDAVVVSGQVHTPNNEILTIGAWNPNVTLGDVNSDGEITVLDAMCVAQYIVGDIGADKMSVNAADVNGDGEITVLDAMLIAQFIVGDIDSFEQANTQNNMNHTDRESVVLEKPANNNAPMQSIGQAAGDDATGLYGAANNLYGDADNNLSDKDTGSEEADPTEAPSNDPADTGDTFPMRTLIIVMILCAAGVVALVVIGKKKGE